MNADAPCGFVASSIIRGAPALSIFICVHLCLSMCICVKYPCHHAEGMSFPRTRHHQLFSRLTQRNFVVYAPCTHRSLGGLLLKPMPFLQQAATLQKILEPAVGP